MQSMGEKYNLTRQGGYRPQGQGGHRPQGQNDSGPSMGDEYHFPGGEEYHSRGRDEYNLPPGRRGIQDPQEYGLPPEDYPPSAEDQLPPEDVAFAEYGSRRAGQMGVLQAGQGDGRRGELGEGRQAGRDGASGRRSRMRDRIRRLIFLPAASTIAVVSIVLAATESDPLGSDFLMHSGSISSSASPTSSAHSMSPTHPTSSAHSTPPTHPTSPGASGGQSSETAPQERREPVTEPVLDGEVTRYYYVTYQPTGEMYHNPDLTDSSAYEDMAEWVRGVGGDTSDMVLYDYEVTSEGQRLADDSVYVGDEDNLDNALFISGGMVDQYRLDLYYEAYPATQESQTITPGETEDGKIASVVITDAVLSYNVGDTPRATAKVPADANYGISEEAWFELDENGNYVTGYLVSGPEHIDKIDMAYFQSAVDHSSEDGFVTYVDEMQFEEGKTYAYLVGVTPKTGDYDDLPWAGECIATVNGTPCEFDHTMLESVIRVATMTPTVPHYTDSFPSLSNLEPDFPGAFAWSDVGTEHYIRLLDPQDVHSEQPNAYIVAGTVWTDFMGAQVQEVPGMSYDESTNTLTLDHYSSDEMLDVNLMGNGFQINLVGENHLGMLRVWGAQYGGSVTITGSGSLTLNESGLSGSTGLLLNAEESESCLMVDRHATLEVYGSPAILILSTTMEQAIYTLQPITVTGGTPSAGVFKEYTWAMYDENGDAMIDEDGNLIIGRGDVYAYSEHIGKSLYDYSVVDENGNASDHVIFSPRG